ncbi:uncharacterized protein LOC143147600 isoform X1 [Ptiloglossa arizonensis]|uniref:uncharacterized protein LOC143147600 isoform X1 n=1 Tax=Ptiloglossa arizonensis TaxID=3350558 RepID=UPI003FA0DE29
MSTNSIHFLNQKEKIVVYNRFCAENVKFGNLLVENYALFIVLKLVIFLLSGNEYSSICIANKNPCKWRQYCNQISLVATYSVMAPKSYTTFVRRINVKLLTFIILLVFL